MAHRWWIVLFAVSVAASAHAAPLGDIVVTVANEQVTVDGRPPRLGRPIATGSRVTAGEGGRAVVVLADGARLQVAPKTQIAVGESTSVSAGTVHVSCASCVVRAGGSKIAIVGEAQIGVDGGVVRVAARAGSVKVDDVTVGAGFGVRVADGRVGAPRALTAAPTWSVAPPRLALTRGGLVRIEGEFAASVPAHGWHVELGVDSRFDDLAVDAHMAASDTHLVAPSVTAGSYFARVSAVDEDGLEGAYSAVVPIDVSVVTFTQDGTRWSTLEPMVGLYCGFDDRPLSAAATIRVDRRIDHTLHCALDEAGGARAALTVPRMKQSYTFVPRVEFVDLHDGYGRISVELRDETGAPATGLPLIVKGAAGEVITYERELSYPGLHVAIVRWKPGQKALSLSLGIKGADGAMIAHLPLVPGGDEQLKIAQRIPTR